MRSRKEGTKGIRKYLRERMGRRERTLYYDFLPAMNEIIEKPENPAAEWILFLVTALLITTFLWMAFCRLDICVTAAGSVIPQGNMVDYRSLESGEITEVCVEEGSRVEEGAALLRLDAGKEEAELGKLRYEQNLLAVQREAYGEVLSEVLAMEKGETDAPIREGDSWEKTEGSALYLSEDTEESVRKAIRTEQEVFSIKCKEYDRLIAEGVDRKQAEEQRAGYVAERKLELLQNLNSLGVRISEGEAEIDRLDGLVEAKTLKAPVTGTVISIPSGTPHSLLGQGQTVCYIIPDDKPLVFRAYIPTRDIDAIEPGQEVRIKLQALRDTEYEVIKGNISYIPDAAVSLEGQGAVYAVEVTLKDVPREELKAGLEGTMDVIIGERSILDYFMEPFVKGLRESLKEK